jgi:hypothetical protein
MVDVPLLSTPQLVLRVSSGKRSVWVATVAGVEVHRCVDGIRPDDQRDFRREQP